MISVIWRTAYMYNVTTFAPNEANKPLYPVAKRILLLIGLYIVCRLLFLLFNFSYFKVSSFSHILSLFFYGLRFDITAIVITNLLFIVLSVLPFYFFYSKAYQQLLRIIFIVLNLSLFYLILLILNF